MSNLYRNLVIGLIAAILVSLIGLGMINHMQQSGRTATITTLVAPARGTTITINGVKVSEGDVAVKPGVYKVTFSRDGFATESRTVNVKDKDTAEVAVVLDPSTAATREWYTANKADAEKAEQITGTNSEAIADAKINALPVMQRLPRVVDTYRIDYGSTQRDTDDESATALYITELAPGGEARARNWLKYQGYDATNTEIIVKNPRN
ncbi:PEGA domain-containing protein [Candidatus Saccharibacteria bacterium]|nr:PEGA domain-containing protein [Candidatus Saccharibacteria bacterium]